MKSTKLKKSELSISVLLIVGILIVVNFFSYQLFYRLDLTENKIFSISDVSRNAAASLDDIVNIKAYFSQDLPGPMLSVRQEVSDILDEYAAYSNGNIRVEFIDPGDDEELQRELYMLGIPQLTFDVFEKDKRQLQNGYMGIAVSYGDKTEVIPAVKQNTSDLEYQLTTAIKKVKSSEIATIGFLTDHGAKSPDETLSAAKTELEDLYEVRSVIFDENSELSPRVNTLVIAGPTQNFSDAELKSLNKFMVEGGAMVLLWDGVQIEQGLLASKNSTSIEKLFSKYGLTLNKNLVGDTRSGTASFSQGFMTFTTNYAFWPMITGEGFDLENGAVSGLESVTLPWASSISIDRTKLAEDSVSILMQTTPEAWAVKDNFNVTPQSANKPQGDTGSFDLAVSVMGELNNPYPEEGMGGKFMGKMVIVGDSDFIDDNFLRNSPDNLTLFQNLVDTLSFDQDLISIRSKAVSSRPIKELEDSERAAIRYLNVFGVTVLVLAFGLFRYFSRRKSGFADDIA